MINLLRDKALLMDLTLRDGNSYAFEVTEDESFTWL